MTFKNLLNDLSGYEMLELFNGDLDAINRLLNADLSEIETPGDLQDLVNAKNIGELDNVLQLLKLAMELSEYISFHNFEKLTVSKNMCEQFPNIFNTILVIAWG